MARRVTRGQRSGGIAGKASDLECVIGHESLETCEGQALNAQADLLVVSYRCRLADMDGVSAKAAIDGCVHRGILRDDNARWIREIRYRQIKVKNQEDEKTLLIFTPV